MSNYKDICDVFSEIMQEYIRAISSHPEYIDDIVHRVAIMSEEAGEAMQAVLDLVYKKEPMEHLRNELIQTAAMCLRVILSIDHEGEW